MAAEAAAELDPGASVAAGPAGASARARAPAKVNLTLHVLGRRPDGYHELESLVAFAGACDRLAFAPASELSLTVAGPLATGAGPTDDNLVLRAARALASTVPGLRPGAFHLTKNLPAAAGIGGGSSDAAAALRLLAAENGLATDDPRLHAAAAATGADIPVCLAPTARMMRGAGEVVGPALDLPPLFAVLVNPRVAVPTPAVFRRLGLEPGATRPDAPHPTIGSGRRHAGAVIAVLAAARNDLEPPAVALQPVIGEALALLRADPACRLARMSGSGATVFGLYDECGAAARAARRMRHDRPVWWIRPTVLR